MISYLSTAPSSSSTVITTSVTASATALASGLSMAMWILKRLKRKSSNFELNRYGEQTFYDHHFKMFKFGKTAVLILFCFWFMLQQLRPRGSSTGLQKQHRQPCID